ncbi:MAG: hypothetical protein JSV88_27670 [Candidatus Aminicenantes bacterium]|nr:MAG: hypothetical protein JSV88_27670 [Candidatus Aminicenantes bacterium]
MNRGGASNADKYLTTRKGTGDRTFKDRIYWDEKEQVFRVREQTQNTREGVN